MQWSAIVPVKASTTAKSRLQTNAAWRAELSRAFLQDALFALMNCDQVTRILIVTDDADLALQLDPSIELTLIESIGLNEDLAIGLKRLGTQPSAIVTGDLPCLTPASVSAALTLAAQYDRSFVSDAQGVGTTMLLNQDASQCTPMFGVRSHAKHAAAGFQEIVSEDPAVNALLTLDRRDVDTAVDLWDARRLGIGAATSALLDDL